MIKQVCESYVLPKHTLSEGRGGPKAFTLPLGAALSQLAHAARDGAGGSAGVGLPLGPSRVLVFVQRLGHQPKGVCICHLLLPR